MSVYGLAVLIIAIALLFDYINGFHDAANSIATIVATRVLTPFQAVVWAAFFNFAAAFLFGTAVARTVGRGFVDMDLVTPYVIMAGLFGAIIWDLITWWLGLPTSSSHALIGGGGGGGQARGNGARGAASRLQAQLRCAQPELHGRMAVHPEDDHRRPADRHDLGVLSDDRGVLAVPEVQPLAHGQVFSQAAVALRGGVQSFAWLERRAEDRRHHHRRAVHLQVPARLRRA